MQTEKPLLAKCWLFWYDRRRKVYRENYVHHGQDEAYAQYRDGVAFQKDIEQVYDEIDYKLKQPDFLGKTQLVSS